MYPDIARFGYDFGAPFGGAGGMMTPGTMGQGYAGDLGMGSSMGSGMPAAMGIDTYNPVTSSVGASNPTAAYMQAPGSMSQNGSGAFPEAPGSALSKSGLGMNLGTMQLALSGLQTIGSLWQAWEANKLAKEQFKFTKDFANTNLANQIQAYNTTLEDRTRARSHTEGGSAEDAQAYIDQHSLRRKN